MPLLAREFRGRRLVVLAAVLSVVLSCAGAPPAHAQTEDRTTWTGDPDDGTVQVTDASASGSTCIGDADKSPLRLEIVPGGHVSYCFRLSHEALTDDWWVRILADGSVSGADSGDPYKGLSWIPSIGRQVNKDDSRDWKSVTIAAKKSAVVGTEVTFDHEVWEDDTVCPVHHVGKVTVRVVTPPPSPELRIDDVTVNESAGRAEFTVRLNAAQTQLVYASYATSDDSATADSDYRSANGTVIIRAGETSAPISVTVLDDNDAESNEQFTVNLSNAGAATIADGTGVGTIIDDDRVNPPPDLPDLTIDDVSVAEDAGKAEFTVTADTTSTIDITVVHATADESATAGDDYTTTTGTLTIRAGQLSATFEVPVIDDSEPEAGETFAVNLSNAQGATIRDGRARGTIELNDGFTPPPPPPPPPLPALTIGDATVDEGGGPAEFTVTANAESSGTMTVDYETADDSATAGDDYTSTSGTLTFSAGQRTATIEVPVIDDSDEEQDETFTVRLANPGGATIEDDEGIGTIRDDDGTSPPPPPPPPLPALTIGDATVDEGGGPAEFTVTASAESSGTMTVDYETADDSATAGDDYTSTSGTLTFSAGQRTATIEVTVIDDSDEERDETFTVSLTNPAGATIEDDEGIGTIRDDDGTSPPPPPPLPVLTIGDATVDEGGGPAVFTVTASAESSGTMTVDYATADDSATAGDDYTSTSGTLTFSAGQRTATIEVTVIDDSAEEQDETFKVRLTNPAGATIEDDEGIGTIRDDDGTSPPPPPPPLPALTIGDATVDEGGGPAVFTVTANVESSGTMTVDYATADDSATAGDDYTSTSGTLTFSAGQRTATIEVPVIDDSDEEQDETFKVRLANPGGATIEDDEGIGTIRDDDDTSPPPPPPPPPLPVLTIGDATVDEGGGPAEFTVTASAESSGTMTVDYETADDSATAGDDYTSTSGTLTFSAGQRTATIEVTVIDDSDEEQDETFTVRLANPAGATIEDDEGIGTIRDDDGTSPPPPPPLPVLTIGDATVDEGGGPAVFTVTANVESSGTMTVDYATADDSATAGDDYTSTSGTLTFSAGQRTATIEVTVIDDSAEEQDETFKVRLTNPAGATIEDDEGIGTIRDDDGTSPPPPPPLPVLTIGDATVDEGGGPAVFTVTANVESSGTMTVDYETADDSATAGDDYTSTSGTLTFSAGQRTATIEVPVIDDSDEEQDETFTVRLANPGGATIEDDEGIGTIRDDDGTSPPPPPPPPPLPALTIGDATVDEGGGPAEFTVTANAESSGTMTVDYETADDSATAGDDYTSTSGTLTFSAGQRTATIEVTVIDDSDEEQDEMFKVRLANPGGATIEDDEGIGTIRDDDGTSPPPPPPPLPALTIGDATVDEGGGPAEFTVTANAESSGTMTVDYETADDSATAGDDYTSTSGTLTFSAGQRTATIEVTVIDDSDEERDETFKMRLANPGGATIEDDEGIGTVRDDDGTSPPPPPPPPPLPVLTIGDATVDEGGGPAEFTVTASAESSGTMTVDYETADDSATAGDDYTSTSGTLTFSAGQRTATIEVPVIDDSDEEQDETFKVRLANPAGATIEDDEGIGTIRDDDGTSPPPPPPPPPLPALTIGDATVDEGGGPAVFTVTANVESSGTMTVDYETADDSATAGDDYTSTSGTLTFSAGQRTATIEVPVIDDSDEEQDETFKVRLANPAGATIEDDEGIGTIRDDDGTSPPPPPPPPPLPALTIGDATVDEGGGPAEFTVTANVESSGTMTVDYETADDSATAGDDYTSTSGTLTFSAGQRTATIEVPVIDDSDEEQDETFKVRLANPAGATIEDDEGIGTIRDDDDTSPPPPPPPPPLPVLTIGDATVDEGGGPAVFTVTANVESSGTMTVDYATADDSATAGGDYTSTSGTLTFSAGQRTATIEVTVIDDSAEEQDETFKVRLTNPAGATIEDDEGIGTIRDDDGTSPPPPPVLTIGDATVDEGGGPAVFAVTANVESSGTMTVDYATADDSATAGDDYTSTSGTLTFSAGQRTATIEVTVIDDSDEEQDETFTVSLTNPAGATIEDDEGIGTIRDDDGTSPPPPPPPPLPVLTIGDATVDEGRGPAEFTVTASAESSGTMTVDYATADDSAIAGDDYTSTSGTLTFSAGQRTATIEVTVIDDSDEEQDETFKVRLANPAGATIEDDEGIGTIRDDDGTSPPPPPSLPVLTIGDATVDEGGGPAEFTVTASAESSGTMTVDYETADDSAIAGDDYTSTSGTLTFSAGQRTATIEVTVIDDSAEEQDETFKVHLTNPAGATIEDDEGIGTIRDDDDTSPPPPPPPLPVLTIGDATVDEGGGPAVFTVTANVESSGTRTVDYATADDSATAGGDYTSTSGTLTFSAGRRTATIEVTVIDDSDEERDETFTVTLSKATGATIADAEGVGTIRDDDGVTPPPPPPLPVLTIGDAAVDEDAGTAEFTVRMSAASTEAVSVGYATSDHTTEAGLDYTSTSGTLTMTAGLTVATIAVTVIDDDVAEGEEAFAVTLSGATGATISDGEGIGTIRDDDLPAVSVSFGAASYQVVEGESVEVAVVLAPAVNRSVTVPLIHLPGEGATEADYSGVPEDLVFESLETRRTFRVLATADAETEEGESVVLGFGTLPAGVTAGATATSTVSLEDSGFSRRRVTERWLQRFGSTAASHAIDAINERLRCARYHYSLDATSGYLPGRWKCNPWFQRRASLAINGLAIEGLRQDAPAASGIRWIRGPSHGWTERLGGHLDRRPHDLRTLGAAEVLTGTSFHLSTGPEDGPPGLSVWGRGSFSQIKGREEDISLDGDVTSATFGADYSAARVLGGLAVSYSDGDGELSRFHSGRKVSSTLTSVYPYVFLDVNERISVWGAAGLGSGSMRLPTSDVESNRTRIAMKMGAAGSRTEVRTPRRPGDLALALKSETLLLRIRSDETPEIEATKTDTSRMRFMLEGATDHALDETGHVSPFFEIGLRRDGGDGDPGFGVEGGGGVRYTRPEIGLTAEFGARGLLAHSVDGYREWGASGSVRYDPYPGSPRGPLFVLSSSLGPMAASGLDPLWRREMAADSLSDLRVSYDQSIGAEVGYGFPIRGGAATGIPWAGVSLSERRRTLRLGYRVRIGESVTVGVDQTLQQDTSGDDTAHYAIMARLCIR